MVEKFHGYASPYLHHKGTLFVIRTTLIIGIMSTDMIAFPLVQELPRVRATKVRFHQKMWLLWNYYLIVRCMCIIVWAYLLIKQIVCFKKDAFNVPAALADHQH